MAATPSEHLKHRELCFCALHPDPHQARSAMLLLSDVRGVVRLELLGSHRLRVGYDFRALSLRVIEQTLVEIGFHLDNSLLVKLKRALYHYTEDVQLQNLGCERGESNCTRNIFISRYSQRPHGCRDARPEHWRRYW